MPKDQCPVLLHWMDFSILLPTSSGIQMALVDFGDLFTENGHVFKYHLHGRYLFLVLKNMSFVFSSELS